MREDSGHRIHHHVRLPSGRLIEVVYLDSRGSRTPVSPAPGDAGRHERAAGTLGGGTRESASQAPWGAAEARLHVCPRCAGSLVHPLDWSEVQDGRWRILMRCPDCGLMRDEVFGEAQVERLDEELDRASAELLSDLKNVTQANMAAEIELFTRALELDLIGPNDFAV